MQSDKYSIALNTKIKYFSMPGIEVVNLNSLGIASEGYTFSGG